MRIEAQTRWPDQEREGTGIPLKGSGSLPSNPDSIDRENTPSPKQDVDENVVISITGDVPDSLFFLNNDPVTFPLVAPQNTQTGILKITAPGYLPFETSVEFSRDNVLHLDMQKESPPLEDAEEQGEPQPTLQKETLPKAPVIRKKRRHKFKKKPEKKPQWEANPFS